MKLWQRVVYLSFVITSLLWCAWLFLTLSTNYDAQPYPRDDARPLPNTPTPTLTPLSARRLFWQYYCIPPAPDDVQRLCDANRTKQKTAGPSCPLQDLAKDCPFLAQMHGYHDKPVTSEETDFPVAFGIKVHTAPAQAEQLLRAIYRPHNVYCLHVDRNSPRDVIDLMTSLAACFPNVILTERIPFVYGGYDAVRAELRTMACALDSSVRWKYYLNLAGQEFPLKTNLEIVKLLKILNGTNDIESFPMPKGQMHRFQFKHEVKNGKVVRTEVKKDPPPFEATIRKGSQYGAFSRAFVTALFYDDTAKSVLEFFKDTEASDENVWATINALPSSPGGYTAVVRHTPDNQQLARAVAWQGVDSYRCRGFYLRQVCVFSQGDLPWLLAQPNLFANKFHDDVDPRPVTCLEAVLSRRATSRDVDIDLKYVMALPQVKG